jgi:SAM-dependent methyltransferase
MSSHDDLDTVMSTATGFWGSQVLFTAVELDLFTALARQPADGETISARWGLRPPIARDFLDSLVALGLLETDDGRYRPSPAAAAHLDAEQPAYVGGFLRFMSRSLYPAWGQLPDLLRKGDSDQDDNSFAGFYSNPERVRGFMSAMDGASTVVAHELARVFPWARHTSFADLGGARGNLAATLVRAHPHLTATCFDVPQVKTFFEEHMRTLGTEGRVHFQEGDFRTDPLPAAEVLIFGHVLHDWPVDDRARLIERAFQALPADGTLLIYDELVDDDRRGPARSLLMSLNMQVVRGGAAEYTAAEARTWLTAAGFQDVTVQPLAGTDRLIVAHKK